MGLIYLHIYNLKGHKTSYVNYLPIWNFILIFFLPKKTLLGPITGSEIKKNKFYVFLKVLGILVLKNKYKTLLFSHKQFYKYFKGNKSNFYNFLLYNFKSYNNNKIKKFDITFYLRKHSNKGNKFLINLINHLSIKYKISILGDDIKNIKKSKNIYIHKKLSRQKAQLIISKSKSAIATKENLFSFFVVDCLQANLKVFYNKNFLVDKNVRTNLLIPINFEKFNSSIGKIKKNLNKKNNVFINIRKVNFVKYLDYCNF